MNIGEKIKSLRIKKGMTQQELAEKSNISRVSVGNYERGDRVPNIEVISNIANALGVTVNELTGVEETIPKKYIELLLQEGKTLEEISKEKGLSTEALNNILHNPWKVTGEEISLLFKGNLSSDEALEKILYFIDFDTIYKLLQSLDGYTENNVEDWTEEELELMNDFKEFLLMRRKKKKNNQ